MNTIRPKNAPTATISTTENRTTGGPSAGGLLGGGQAEGLVVHLLVGAEHHGVGVVAFDPGDAGSAGGEDDPPDPPKPGNDNGPRTGRSNTER